MKIRTAPSLYHDRRGQDKEELYMKKIFLLGCLLVFSLGIFAQAKKPVLMIVPSDSWMAKNNFMKPIQDMSGETKYVADYSMAFLQNDEFYEPRRL